MKFFTTEWWAEGCEGAEELFESYSAHLSSIREKLPPALIDLHQNHTLHDARVENIVCSFADRSVKMSLLGWDQRMTHPVHYQLVFLGVSHFEQSLPLGRSADAELGDLGYWECAVTLKGIEVSMLFASSAEFTLSFEGFSFSHTGSQ